MAESRDVGGITASPLQLAAAVVGAGFLLSGILGFVPGVTTNYDDITFAGHESGALLLDIFQVSILHNVVHVLFGVAGLAMARSWSGARTFLLGGGVIYLALWVFGLLVADEMSSANFVPLNDADNWLHLGLGAAMLLFGVALGRRAGPVGHPA